MAIKVVVNYPESKEEMEKLKERQSQALAEAVLEILSNRLTSNQLDKLMSRL
ncbi:hypothetical protein HYH82_15490 [Clostridium botulinum]|uniref:hypothetical protein n=1 Tax=Clostridium botulinum TaxID=1491 RepID=UPI001C9B6E3A|nr:hypothetical protein [Clostridium botulinum]MBY6758696.1 hypothetical protein [Clostridium botulinum]MCR1166770.1 hypothetical protein [Clostridium botulinum]